MSTPRTHRVIASNGRWTDFERSTISSECDENGDPVRLLVHTDHGALALDPSVIIRDPELDVTLWNAGHPLPAGEHVAISGTMQEPTYDADGGLHQIEVTRGRFMVPRGALERHRDPDAPPS